MWLFAGDEDDDTDDDDTEPSKFNTDKLFHNLSKMFFKNELDSQAATTTTSSLSTTSTSSENAQIDNDEKLLTSPHYIYRKKCQMEDDWGTIGLNCTNDDVVVERVVVIGFLVNWIEAFIHIRSELVLIC